MTAFANLSFETAGAGAGLAGSWTYASTATYEEIAAYGATPDPWETFEAGWSNDGFLFAFAALSFSAAIYSPLFEAVPVETFDRRWSGNEGFVAAMPTTDRFFDTFEAGWAGTFLTAFGGGDVSSGGVNSFETGWAGTVLTAFGGGDLEAALYDAGVMTYDGFDGALWPAL